VLAGHVSGQETCWQRVGRVGCGDTCTRAAAHVCGSRRMQPV